MLYSKLMSAAAMSVMVSSAFASTIERPWHMRSIPTESTFFSKRANGSDSNLALDPQLVQKGSQATGNQGDLREAGQADSLTDNANFINFCGQSGQDITNGIQKDQGSCNGITMGKIPSQDAMTTSIITNPKPGDDLDENQDFDVQVQVNNLQAGSFTNPDVTYYAAPQDLNGDGVIIGHTHVTIQDLGGTLSPDQPPDAKTTAFFLGIDDDGNGAGLLKAAVTGGLKAGFYRVCTMASSSNHQPVLMPIAQRGAQDDCTKFTVGQGGGNGGGNNTAKRNVYNPAERAALYDTSRRFAARNFMA